MTQIQLRRDTANNWQTANPILAQGEIGIDLTNKLIKIGDGATAWNNLNDYAGDYNDVLNKPQINNIVLSGNKTGADLGLADNADVVELSNELNQLTGNVTSLTTTVNGKQDTLTAGTGITIEDNVISATGGSTPTNMVTTDTEQTITGEKTIAGNTPLNFGTSGSNIEYNSTSGYLSITSNARLGISCTYVYVPNAPIRAKQYQIDTTYNVCSHNNSTATLTFGDATRKAIFQCNEPLTINRNGQSYTNIDSGNIGNYTVTTTQGIKLWKGTQTEYEAITTKDENTLYIITGA